MIFPTDQLIGGSHYHLLECDACQRVIYIAFALNIAWHIQDHPESIKEMQSFADDCGIEWKDIEEIHQDSLMVKRGAVNTKDVGSNPTPDAKL